MLVGYSSSSDEEEDAEENGRESAKTRLRTRKSCRNSVEEDRINSDDFPAKKKNKIADMIPRTRLPLPGSLLDMFPDEDDPQTENSTLHGGRVRSFKHERGNWATYVYFPYHPKEDFQDLLDALLSAAGSQGLGLTPQEEFHLSLSQTVVLRHYWIQPFTQSLRAGLAHCKRFFCSAERLKIYCNAEKTRTFLGIEVSSGHTQLLDLVQVVDKTMTEFQLETFYDDPSFHVSLAWCVGDLTEKLKEILEELQSLVYGREDGPLPLVLDCAEVRCRTGNKTFRFSLDDKT